MANEEPTEGSKPRDGPFNDPAMPIRAQPAPIFMGAVNTVLAVRTGDERAAGEEIELEFNS